MTQLSARARSLVERAQKEAAPSAEDLSRLRARLTSSLASQAPDTVVLPFWLGQLAGVVAAGALAVGAWHLRGTLADHDRQASAASVTAAQRFVPEASISCPPVPSCAPPPAEPAKALPTKTVGCSPPQESSEDHSPRRSMEDSLFSVEAARRDPSLELELLILAQGALDEERSIDALGHTLKHDQLYPHSAFEEERLAIQVLAYCSVGNMELAARQLERLMELSPETTYLPRVRGTCGEDFVQASGRSEPQK